MSQLFMTPKMTWEEISCGKHDARLLTTVANASKIISWIHAAQHPVDFICVVGSLNATFSWISKRLTFAYKGIALDNKDHRATGCCDMAGLPQNTTDSSVINDCKKEGNFWKAQQDHDRRTSDRSSNMWLNAHAPLHEYETQWKD